MRGIRKSVPVFSLILVASSLFVSSPLLAYLNLSFSISDYEVGRSPTSLAVGDFNSDGIPDLVVANEGNIYVPIPGDISILIGRGDGSFFPEYRISLEGTWARSVAVGDLNLDEHLDFVVAMYNYNLPTGSEVLVFLGQGDGNFGLERNLAVGEAPHQVVIDDLNGDRSPDFVVAHSVPQSVGVLLGWGTGNFAEMVQYPTGYAWSVAIGDFNADLIKDLATANHGGWGGVSILLGRGDGTFEPEIRYPDFSGDSWIEVDDFNHDGFQDLVVVNTSREKVNILLGVGDGSFGPPRFFSAGEQPRSVAVGDFDGDGERDLAVANYASNDVSVLRGDGTGGFSEDLTLNIDYAPQAVVAGDFNRDGRTDLATANWGRIVSVLLNFPLFLEVPVDFRPGRCPNPLNANFRGMFTVGLLGTPTFDVQQVDPATIRLFGTQPRKISLKDAGTPFEPFLGKEGPFSCHVLRQDGIQDLVLKFESEEIIEQLPLFDEIGDNIFYRLTLTGNLKPEFGGIMILGQDIVLIKKP